MKFRKRPVVIEAIQYEGGKDFNLLRLFVGNDFPLHRLGGDVLGISTLESDLQRIVPGDWLVRGVKGEFYPCKPDVFAMTYEQVDGPESPAPVAKEPDYKAMWEEIKEYLGYPDVEDIELDALGAKIDRIEKAHGVEVSDAK